MIIPSLSPTPKKAPDKKYSLLRPQDKMVIDQISSFIQSGGNCRTKYIRCTTTFFARPDKDPAMALARGETKKPRTVLRTLRISSALDDALTSKAARNKIGKNALLVSVLSRYVEWDSGAEDLGYMMVPYQMIAELLGNLEKDAVASIAKRVSKSVASSIPLWFGSADVDRLAQVHGYQRQIQRRASKTAH